MRNVVIKHNIFNTDHAAFMIIMQHAQVDLARV